MKNNNSLIFVFGFFISVIVSILIILHFFERDDLNVVYNFTLFELEESLEGLSISELKEVEDVLSLNDREFDQSLLVGFNVDNNIDRTIDKYVLEFSNPHLHKVDLYRVNDEGVIQLFRQAGTLVPNSNPLTYPRPVFEIDTKELEGSFFIVDVFSTEPIGFNLILTEKFDFLSKYTNRVMLFNVYLGLMLALFLYNLILFFLIKDRLYFYYSFYVLFISLAQLSIVGVTFYYFLGENTYLYNLSIILFPSIAGVLAVLFIRLFLKTSHFVPVMDKLLKALTAVYALAIICRLTNFVSLSYTIVDVAGVAGVVLFMTVGVKIALRGYRPAIFFLTAWAVFLVGLLIFVMQNFGIITISSASNLPMLIGTAFEAILLSLALADRINILKKEKEQEQYEKLAALKENERLVKEQNLILEEKVHIRTEELEKTLKNLQDTQTQLVNQEKMASLGQLTAGVAHEINNPINFVSSNVNPLKRDVADLIEIMDAYREKGAKEFSDASLKELKNLEDEIELEYVIGEIDQLLQGMEDGAKRTVEIVKGLKLFSRIDEQDVKKVDIHAGISSTLVLLNSSMSNKIQIVKDFGQIPMVECLAGKINQVFMNIVNNAVHALTEHLDKNPNPEIIIRTSMDGDDFVKIEIIDNGPGIPDEVKARIFEPFFTTKPVGKGTGLGLSIVFTIIEKHSGTLEVESCPDAGTAFIIRLPVHQESDMI
ncbi:phosphate starvation-inducible protein PsiE [Litoribacter ruber]|uniref:7TM diverse intracellular signaling domain-containing protein n=1 Tax=Litoribacter ruber TaxID=702568 RepID=UPI001BD92AEA|nr:7TM diverse intracellular signaling domain-containing protein [Litoribacter ruber]MBT0812395.1 phosphate starvation-inducible protein PsiE [Litoribacter ruber]